MNILFAAFGALAATAGLLNFAAENALRREGQFHAVSFTRTSLIAEVDTVGLGVVVSERGQVVTVAHVVRGCLSIRVARGGGAAVGATTEALDVQNDLALLKTGLTGIAPVRLGVAANRDAAKPVYFVGMEGRHGAIPGRIPVHRARVAALYGPKRDVRLFTFISGWSAEAPSVRPGDSGGPVFDAAGNVVGIVAGRPAISTPAVDSILRRTAFAVNAGIVRLFLAAHEVTFASSGGTNAAPERAAQSTVRVWCDRRAPVTSSVS